MSDRDDEALAAGEHTVNTADEKKKKRKRNKGKGKKQGAGHESAAPLSVENGEDHHDDHEHVSDHEDAAGAKHEIDEMEARRKQEEEEIARLAAEIEAKKLRDAEETSRREEERRLEESAKEHAAANEKESLSQEEVDEPDSKGSEASAGKEEEKEENAARAATPDSGKDVAGAAADESEDEPGPKGKEPVADEALPPRAPEPLSSSASQQEDGALHPEQRLQRQREDTYERAKSEVRVSDSDIDRVANFEKHKHVVIRKRPEQSLGFMITETGRTSLLPCIFISHVFPGSAAAKSGELFVGDHILSVDGMSVVGLPFAKVLEIFRAVANHEMVELIVVPVDPVAVVTVSRHDSPSGKLGFDVLHGEIISVDKDGPADLAGLKAGHRITEINGQSVVDHTHEQIVQALQVDKVLLKTMPRDLFQTLMTPVAPPTQ